LLAKRISVERQNLRDVFVELSWIQYGVVRSTR
jgi:hypothetical protein